MPGPLAGIRVFDLTHVLNGPLATMILASMGAEVIKVEYGPGDRFRHVWMPPDVDRDGYEFLQVNHSKLGITLNLKTEKGKEIFRRLVAVSDVLAENFTVGVLDRLGLGYETLREINPRLIYACSRGFGETGPYAHVRSNAAINMAMSGWEHTAHRLAEKPGARVLGAGDEVAGASLALGVCAALYAREQTGLGQKIEVSMQEAQLGFMTSSLHTLFEGQPVGFPSKQCADGYYAFHMAGVSDDQWHKLATAMGRPDLLADPRFQSTAARARHSVEIETILTDWVRGKTRRELWETLSEIGFSSGPVLSLSEVVDDPHIQARQAFVTVEHPVAGEVKLLAPWIRFSETPAAIQRPAPAIGQHNREVYQGVLGVTDQELAALEAEGVI